MAPGPELLMRQKRSRRLFNDPQKANVNIDRYGNANLATKQEKIGRMPDEDWTSVVFL